MKIIAEEGFLFSNKTEDIKDMWFSKVIYLGVNDNLDRYRKVTVEYAEDIKKQLEDLLLINELNENAQVSE